MAQILSQLIYSLYTWAFSPLKFRNTRRDARSITRTLENIKDPEQVEKAVLTENVEIFVERNKQVKK